ncbi:uncharacterized protein LOC123424413 [Hordeum vulgare subsp. vulgare]|uniref:uncharacterized protein LOC123424413 n=1 Tax=Hordeum vulgare subsp. vulgare TaxID=112509 RepID=UPI001D1A5836|nr:uncharacterized protein LOC123424413 [Hordeum vulgare subsp. vulgare]
MDCQTSHCDLLDDDDDLGILVSLLSHWYQQLADHGDKLFSHLTGVHTFRCREIDQWRFNNNDLILVLDNRSIGFYGCSDSLGGDRHVIHHGLLPLRETPWTATTGTHSPLWVAPAVDHCRHRPPTGALVPWQQTQGRMVEGYRRARMKGYL